MSEPDLPRWAVAVCVLSALATVVWSTWMTVVAFVGGTMPMLGWQTDGGVGVGLLWVLVVDPLVVSLCGTATVLVVTTATVVLRRLDWTDEHDRRWLE